MTKSLQLLCAIDASAACDDLARVIMCQLTCKSHVFALRDQQFQQSGHLRSSWTFADMSESLYKLPAVEIVHLLREQKVSFGTTPKFSCFPVHDTTFWFAGDSCRSR